MGWRAGGGGGSDGCGGLRAHRIRSCFVYLFRRKKDTSLEPLEEKVAYLADYGRQASGQGLIAMIRHPRRRNWKGGEPRAEGRILREAKKSLRNVPRV